MEEIVTILSTREWAIVIWGTGFFVWMLTQREIRKSLWNVIKILLGKKLRHFFLIIALYVAGITTIFYQLHIVHILSENCFLPMIGKRIADIIEGRVMLANDICAEMR